MGGFTKLQVKTRVGGLTKLQVKTRVGGLTKLQVFDVAAEDNFSVHHELYHVPVFDLLQEDLVSIFSQHSWKRQRRVWAPRGQAARRADVFTDGHDWPALQLFKAITQPPRWAPTWHSLTCPPLCWEAQPGA